MHIYVHLCAQPCTSMHTVIQFSQLKCLHYAASCCTMMHIVQHNAAMCNTMQCALRFLSVLLMHSCAAMCMTRLLTPMIYLVCVSKQLPISFIPHSIQHHQCLIQMRKCHTSKSTGTGTYSRRSLILLRNCISKTDWTGARYGLVLSGL